MLTIGLGGALEVESGRIADMLVIDGRNRCPEGPMEESYLQRRARGRKVWIASMVRDSWEVESPSPSPSLPCWSRCLNHAAKAENMVGFFFALPHRRYVTFDRAARSQSGVGVWMFSIPGSGMQLFAVPLEIAACRPRIAGIGSL